MVQEGRDNKTVVRCARAAIVEISTGYNGDSPKVPVRRVVIKLLAQNEVNPR